MADEPSSLVSLIPPGFTIGEPLQFGSIEHAQNFYREVDPFRIEPLDRQRFGICRPRSKMASARSARFGESPSQTRRRHAG